MTTALPTDKPKVQVYLDEEMKIDGEKLAKRRQRSLSSLIRYLLQEEIERAKANGEIE